MSEVTSQEFGSSPSLLSFLFLVLFWVKSFEGKNIVIRSVWVFVFAVFRLSVVWLLGFIRSASSNPYWFMARIAMWCDVVFDRVNCLSASRTQSANFPPPGTITI